MAARGQLLSHSGRNRALSHEKQRLVIDNQGLAIRVAQSLNIRPLGKDSEGRAEAMLGLVVAAQTFDPSHGAAFSTWAWIKIRSHLLDWLKREGRRSQRYEPQDDVQAVCPAISPEQEALDIELDRKVRAAYDGAPDLVRQVGLLVLQGRSNSEVAARLGISESTVEDRRKRSKALLAVEAMILADPGPRGPEGSS